MRAKIAILMSLVLCSILAVSSAVVPVRAESGPATPKLFIKNYGTSEKEFLALETGEIDITDWPISKTFIDKWTLGPDGKPGTGDELVPGQITLRDYSEIGVFEYDLYNQRWPTGVGDRLEDALTLDPKTGTYKHFFDPTNEWDLRAWQFRLAIMYLVDKDYIKTEILKGYGMMMDTLMPAAIMGWLDMANLTKSSFTAPYGGIVIDSLIYKPNVAKAKALLDAAGFTVNPATGIRRDPRLGKDLDPLIFYIRSDHTERRLAGEKLTSDLVAIGVPVDSRVVAKTVAFKSVMVDYNYHLYTGGYSLGVDPTFIYGILDSSQYWGAPMGSKYDGTAYDIGWSGGYQAFCNKEFDKYSTDFILYGATKKDVEWGVHNATYILNKYVGQIPLWASAGVQGYRTGWTGVVNQFGYGISAPLSGGAYLYSLLNMKDTYLGRPTHPPGYTTDTLVWGFKSNAEAFSVLTSEWVWDWNVLTAMYDLLITTNPYNPADDWPWLATSWEVGEWMHPTEGASTVINFTLRQNAYWHWGGQVTPADIQFSIAFTRDAGPGVAWNYPGAMDVDHVITWDNRAAGGGWGVKVFFKILSFYALHYVGWLPMFSKDVWMAASGPVGFGYTPTPDGSPGTMVDRLKVREYHPYKDNYFNPAAGKADMIEDGSGPWIYVGADAALMEYYELAANPAFWQTQTEVSNRISEAFHDIGDVNRDREVSTPDMSLVAHALLATPASGGTPGEWWAWNADADLDKSNRVDGDDLAIAGKSYGMNAG